MIESQPKKYFEHGRCACHTAFETTGHFVRVYAKRTRSDKGQPPSTTIYFYSECGCAVALRVAAELARAGVAALYHSDRDFTIYLGERHEILLIGDEPGHVRQD